MAIAESVGAVGMKGHIIIMGPRQEFHMVRHNKNEHMDWDRHSIHCSIKEVLVNPVIERLQHLLDPLYHMEDMVVLVDGIASLEVDLAL